MVQVVVDDRPALRLVLGLQLGGLGQGAADEHHVLDERGGAGGERRRKRERGDEGQRLFHGVVPFKGVENNPVVAEFRFKTQ